MKKIHTHYDNLKISRNAPREVIRAAYKALSQKYHPDKNRRPDAQKVMAIINHAYAVLSDDGRRRRHDAWIAAQEGQQDGAPAGAEADDAAQEAPAMWRFRLQWHAVAAHLTPLRVLAGASGLILLLLYLWLAGAGADRHAADASEQAAARAAQQDPVTTAVRNSAGPHARRKDATAGSDGPGAHAGVEARKKPALGPDGFPWPLGPRIYRADAAYRNGWSTVTIDNSRNAHAVHGKLGVAAGAGIVAREFYIPRHRIMTLENLTAGDYYIKYRDLESGRVFRSAGFRLQGADGDGAASYDSFALALHTNAGRDAEFSSMPESEF